MGSTLLHEQSGPTFRVTVDGVVWVPITGLVSETAILLRTSGEAVGFVRNRCAARRQRHCGLLGGGRNRAGKLALRRVN